MITTSMDEEKYRDTPIFLFAGRYNASHPISLKRCVFSSSNHTSNPRVDTRAIPCISLVYNPQKTFFPIIDSLWVRNKLFFGIYLWLQKIQSYLRTCFHLPRIFCFSFFISYLSRSLFNNYKWRCGI